MTYSERRKADRAAMVEIVRELAVSEGAEATIEDRPFGDIEPRTIVCRIRAARGLCLTVDLNGDSSQPDVYVLSWHVDYKAPDEVKLSRAYWPSLNTCHFRKATDIAEGFDALCDVLRRRLADIREGKAFQ